jgi:hypothetical protein
MRLKAENEHPEKEKVLLFGPYFSILRPRPLPVIPTAGGAGPAMNLMLRGAKKST